MLESSETEMILKTETKLLDAVKDIPEAKIIAR
jgi:hypothetical protein